MRRYSAKRRGLGIFFKMPVLGLVVFGGFTAGIFGCAPAVTMEETAAQTPAVAQPQATPAEKSQQPPAAVKEAALEEQPFRIQELSVREEKGQTFLHLAFSTPVAQYRHFALAQPSRIVLDVFGDAKRLARVESFRVDTHWASGLRLSSGDGYLRLVVDIIAATVPPYVIEPENGSLKVVVGPVNPAFTAKKDVQVVKGGRRTDVQVAEAKGRSPQAALPPAVSPGAAAEKRYTGQRISLDFKDADIKNVFRLLAEVSGLNIVVTGDVQRRVTVRLVDVPWDQAMDLLVDTNGLGKEQVGNVVRISTAAQLKSEKDALAAAKKAEENLEPLQTAYLSVNYAKVKDLVEKIKPALTTRGTIVHDDRSNTIVVRDIKRGIEEANTVVGRLDTRTAQVLIESNLIETTPTFARALGFRFQMRRGGTTMGSSAGAGAPFSGALGPAGSLPTGLGAVVSVMQSRIGGIQDLASALEAAENQGNIKIISRPSIVTLNNVASTIQSLRILRITLPTSTNIATGTGAAAGGAVATERVPVGIILTVTPQVSSDGFVLMSITVKSSSIAESATVGGGVAGVVPFDELTREAIANVLVRDGETIVIGGILKDTRAESEGGVPWLKDIPVFGWLFKNFQWRKDFEELMVFITPRVIAGGSEDLPTAEQIWRDRLRETEGS